ncbi:TolB family protein [Ralstonia mannitolilytica]
MESIDAHADAYRSSLWIAGNEDEPPWQLTSGTALDSAPQWAPDARTIAFLSDRDGGPPQIYTIRPHGGEARRLTNLPNGVQTFAWAPDGRSLLAIALAHVDPPDTTHGKRCAEGVQVITEVPYKLDGVGFTLDERTHLFTVDAGSGAHRQLTQGRYEVRHATWSADGESLYYTRTRRRQDGAPHRHLDPAPRRHGCAPAHARSGHRARPGALAGWQAHRLCGQRVRRRFPDAAVVPRPRHGQRQRARQRGHRSGFRQIAALVCRVRCRGDHRRPQRPAGGGAHRRGVRTHRDGVVRPQAHLGHESRGRHAVLRGRVDRRARAAARLGRRQR